MVESADGRDAVDVLCPHCKKKFRPKLIGSGAGERYRGFKCPHCKLFVPVARAVEDELKA
ncbi:MAG: hypothetical protein ACJ79L_11405 [Anaeromyxobacteraceae bacterium]